MTMIHKSSLKGSLRDSQNEDVFAEGLPSPDCVVISVNYGETECEETDRWNL